MSTDSPCRCSNDPALVLPESLQHVLPLIDSLLEHVVIVDAERRIVHANPSFLHILEPEQVLDLNGKRFGNAVGCSHAGQTEGGCGSTKFCKECGAYRAQMAAFAGEPVVEECRIVRADGGALNFRIRASHWDAAGRPLLIITALDTSGEERRRLLEKLFFHDVRNTVGGVTGLAEYIGRAQPLGTDSTQTALIASMTRLTRQLLDEIDSFACLSEAENGELTARNEPCDPGVLLEAVRELYERQKLADRRTITVDCEQSLPIIQVDRVLVSRVVGNFVKNALEATKVGESITVGARWKDAAFEFYVQNLAVIPEREQLQIFQRSFSTKGPGRGLGTHSAQLIGERVLGAKVGFTSNATEGTVFWIRLPESALTG
ncbi:MAG: PAS domain-containing sensor histidine kinase [Verrucomicrobia bacterium]|nr:PAS domain-containing sensor histidine kinase [Verrucomicrobiota bacterium]